jgi:CDP-glucose 4,6-dehydratase
MELAWRPEFWHGRRVLITGHTGFIGSWLALALADLGAEVHGLALAPATEPALFSAARLEDIVSHRIVDIRNADATLRAVTDAAPEVVFHLAAQPLVRLAHREPLETFSTNVMGTAHVLEAVRRCASVRAVVAFTTDKVYENQEWRWGYREIDRLGGHEPYGASKAAAEHVLETWAQSYFRQRDPAVHLAVVRAGNVIGGGDWAEDRLIPDAMRASGRGQPLVVRRPRAVRPWQHVLEPVAASLILGRTLCENPATAEGAWNIGPEASDMQPVQWIADRLNALWPSAPAWRNEDDGGPYEAGLLMLDSTRARDLLGWRPRWRLDRALAETVSWYHSHAQGGDARALTRRQIEVFFHGEPSV